MRRPRGGWPAAVLCALLAACAAPAEAPAAGPTPTPAPAPATIVLTSPAFVDGGDVPAEYSCLPGAGPLPLRWEGIPEGTAEVAIVMEDVSAAGKLHWMVAGIDPAAPGWPQDPPVEAVEVQPYFGPCPNRRSEYRITVLALAEPSRTTADESGYVVADRLATAATATGRLTGWYP